MTTLMMLVGLIVSATVTLVVYSVYILVICFMVWMIIDAGKQDRFWWMAIILGVPIAGSVAYYYTEKKHKYSKADSHHIHTRPSDIQHEKTPEKLAHQDKHEDAQEK